MLFIAIEVDIDIEVEIEVAIDIFSRRLCVHVPHIFP